MDVAEQGAIGEAHRSLRSLSSSEQGDGRALWIVGRRLSNQLVSRANGEALGAWHVLDGLNVLDDAQWHVLFSHDSLFSSSYGRGFRPNESVAVVSCKGA